MNHLIEVWYGSWNPWNGRIHLPGVTYHDGSRSQHHDEKEIEILTSQLPSFKGPTFHHAYMDLMTEEQKEYVKQLQNNAPSVEDVPYSFSEKVGCLPIHAARLRPRQYYMPTTNFERYDYDEASPEEEVLKSAFYAKALEFDVSLPAAGLLFSALFFMKVPSYIRLTLISCITVTALMAEFSRSWLAANKERLELDDFLLAKELWYIKNDEVREHNIPTMKRGSEWYYQTRMDEEGNTVLRFPSEEEEVLRLEMEEKMEKEKRKKS